MGEALAEDRRHSPYKRSFLANPSFCSFPLSSPSKIELPMPTLNTQRERHSPMGSSPFDDLRISQLRERLAAYGQQHLLAFWSQLSFAQQQQLATQIEGVDLEQFAALRARYRGKPLSELKDDYAALAARAAPPPAMRLDGSGAAFSPGEAVAAGEHALSRGEVALVLVAGGLGTRLGFDQPKGLFPIGPASGRTFFQIFVDLLRAVSKRYGQPIPLLVMTSPATDAATRDYFVANNFLGLPSEQVRFFCQGTMFAVDDRWDQILLESPGELFLGPDGHGGMLSALARGGHLADLQAQGIKTLFYGQIDNPLLQLCAPLLVGGHLLARSEMTTQAVRKKHALERVGNVVAIDNRVQVIEYSDLPESFARAVNPDGSLRLWAGNMAVHLFDVDFLAREAGRPDDLPFHLAHKRVPHMNAAGERVDPPQPNAIRFERFIFDLLPLAQNSLVIEADATVAFAPVKNSATDPTDNPRTARELWSALHRGWLRSAGWETADDAVVEINPLFALDADELCERLAGKIPHQLSSPAYFAPSGLSVQHELS